MNDQLKEKRIAAIDYGRKRVGTAYTDELHISINPGETLPNDDKLVERLDYFFRSQRISALVLGLPHTKDGKKTDWIEKIESFAEILLSNFTLPVFFQDESESSKRAVRYMVESGIKKKKRSEKGSIDKYAACVILDDFLSNRN